MLITLTALDTLTSLESLHTAASHVANVVPLAADDDILGWIRGKANEVRSTILVIAGAVAAGFVVFHFLRTRALTALISAGVTAAVFTWLVNHNSDVQDRVDNEINGLRGPSSVVRVLDAPTGAAAGAARGAGESAGAVLAERA
jgi:hypothetical protein